MKLLYEEILPWINVSLKVPSIHSYIKIADIGVNSHSVDFIEAANSFRAYEQIIKAAKAMALRGYDILTDESLREKIYEEFNTRVSKYSPEELI